MILDDMPYHFRLEEGKLQRSDQPFLPQKVIREAIVNAVMHRDYGIHQPIIVARYRNRLEIHNARYSLKPLEELDDMNSVLRNPILANVLYDLDFAETKGTGFRTMQRLLHEAGLSKPILVSNRRSNQFTATFLLHQLMNEEQLLWLQHFKEFNLSNDEAKALVLVKEIGAIDNAALRAITDLDTLSASQVLGRLWQQYHLIEKGGSGRTTYYKASALLLHHVMAIVQHHPHTQELDTNRSDLGLKAHDFSSNTQGFIPYSQELPDFLQGMIHSLTPKTRKPKLQQIILQLCTLKAYSADELAKILNRKLEALRVNHLTPLRKEDLINYLYPEVINHPDQAYVITKKGKQWLDKNGH